GRISTIRSAGNPRGLLRNQLAWLENGTVRGGGVLPRPGYKALVQGQKWSGLFQGATMYLPADGNPYMMVDIGGHTYQVRVDTDNSVKDVTAGDPLTQTQPYHWYVRGGDTEQAEQFRLTQDGVSEIRVWDGAILRRISAMGGVG